MSKINIYKCKQGHETITRDTEERNVTPFEIDCPQCKESAFSSHYQVSQDLIPEYEWFIPKTIEEYKEACLPIFGNIFSDKEYKSMLDGKSTMYRKIKSDKLKPLYRCPNEAENIGCTYPSCGCEWKL